MSIPKIVHFAWFGGNKKPPIIQMCLDSWKRHLPDYSIIEWNEHNFDLAQYPFAKEAFERKRYAFITDVVRLWALYIYGGIYMDSDVEVVKPLDCFLQHRAFTGHETSELMVTATMGSEKSHPWIGTLLDYYMNREYSEKTNTQIITELSRPLVEKYENGVRYLRNGVVIFPSDYFCPFDHVNHRVMPTANTYAVHHFAGSWTGRGDSEII